MIDVAKLKSRLAMPGRIEVGGLPQGLDAMLLPEVAKAVAPRPLLHVALDDSRIAVLADQLAFFAPGLEVVRFPGWDCLPYDRVSPSADIVTRRLATLSRLVQPVNKPLVVLTTIAGATQRVVAKGLISGATFTAATSQRVVSPLFMPVL